MAIKNNRVSRLYSKVKAIHNDEIAKMITFEFIVTQWYTHREMDSRFKWKFVAICIQIIIYLKNSILPIRLWIEMHCEFCKLLVIFCKENVIKIFVHGFILILFQGMVG